MSKWGRHSENVEWSRRKFLLQTAKFSALAMLESPFAFGDRASADALPRSEATHLLMLGDWGTAGVPRAQSVVATGMRAWAAANKIRPDALLMLGDNFYGAMPGGVKSQRWINQFEQMYPASIFPGPAYAVLGNHDYETFRGNKVEAELAYAAKSTRWRMPSRWYSVKLPQANPVLTLICLDSNIPESKGVDVWPWSFVMTKQQHNEQKIWLENELAKPRSTPFIGIAAHHPLYSNGNHRDNPALIAEWDSLLRQYHVDIYLSGHDHDLQHLEFKNHPTSFVVSGGGGAELVDWSISPRQRGPWGARALGFSHLEITEDELTLRHIDSTGNAVYLFRKPVQSPIPL